MTDIAACLSAPAPDEGDRATAAFATHLAAFAVGVSACDLATPDRRGSPVARARHVAMYLAHVALSWPLARVGMAFGRDRSTAAYACAKVEIWRDDAGFDARLEELETCLQAAPHHRALAPGLLPSPTETGAERT